MIRLDAIDAGIARHERREAREFDRWAARVDRADAMIGELCRAGEQVFYIWPAGGRYREGDRADLIRFLLRNRYI